MADLKPTIVEQLQRRGLRSGREDITLWFDGTELTEDDVVFAGSALLVKRHPVHGVNISHKREYARPFQRPEPAAAPCVPKPMSLVPPGLSAVPFPSPAVLPTEDDKLAAALIAMQPAPQPLRDPPGPTYVCHGCGIGGHWRQDCSTSKRRAGQRRGRGP